MIDILQVQLRGGNWDQRGDFDIASKLFIPIAAEKDIDLVS